jgi:hypothetical protein
MLVAGFLELKLHYSEKNLPIGAIISRKPAFHGAASQHKQRSVQHTAQATWLHGGASSGVWAICGGCLLLLQGNGRQLLVEEAVALREVACDK